jgi:hypothetical protein
MEVIICYYKGLIGSMPLQLLPIGEMPLQLLPIGEMPLQKTKLGDMPLQLSHTCTYAIFSNT